MSIRLVLSYFLSVALFSIQVHGEDLKSCGEARYYSSEYTCYEGNVLCPTVFGLPTLPCNGACYSNKMYECASGNLRLLPRATSPFTMVAHSTGTRSNGQIVKACENFLELGPGARICTSCRDAPLSANCGGYKNQSVLLPNGEMVS
jgi:hypothetical protein